MTLYDKDPFVAGYVECMLWAGKPEPFDDEGNPVDLSHWDADYISPELEAKILKECEAFLQEASPLMEDWEPGQAGHDFWLTRNGHGTGFWDRKFSDKETRDKLSSLASRSGERDVYQGDDGLLYY